MNSEHIKFVSSKHGRVRIFVKTKNTGKNFNQVVRGLKTFDIDILISYFKNDYPLGNIVATESYLKGRPAARVAMVLKSLKKSN